MFKKYFEVLNVRKNVLKSVKNALEYVIVSVFSELIDSLVRCQYKGIKERERFRL